MTSKKIHRKRATSTLGIILCMLLGTQPISAQTIALPRPTGSYAVGTKAIEINDSSRSMLRGAESKRWMIQLFYPAKAHKGTYSYMPGTIENGEVNDVFVKAHAKPDALPFSTQKFPLIVFIPGRGGIRQQYTILLEEIASQGYIVISMDQPYVSSFVTFPDGSSITLNLKDVWKVPRDRDYRYQYDDEVIFGAIKDIHYLLDHLSNFGHFEKIIDNSKITLMGHSVGANIVHIMGFQDKRIKAVVDIDSKITERKVFGNVGIPPNLHNTPIFFIRGNKQYQDDVGDQLVTTQNATLWSPDVEHSAFSDNVYFSAKIKDFGAQGFMQNFINWLLKIGPHWDNVDTNIGEQKVDEWISEYRKRVVDWLRMLEREDVSKESLK